MTNCKGLCSWFRFGSIYRRLDATVVHKSASGRNLLIWRRFEWSEIAELVETNVTKDYSNQSRSRRTRKSFVVCLVTAIRVVGARGRNDRNVSRRWSQLNCGEKEVRRAQEWQRDEQDDGSTTTMSNLSICPACSGWVMDWFRYPQQSSSHVGKKVTSASQSRATRQIHRRTFNSAALLSIKQNVAITESLCECTNISFRWTMASNDQTELFGCSIELQEYLCSYTKLLNLHSCATTYAISNLEVWNWLVNSWFDSRYVFEESERI